MAENDQTFHQMLFENVDNSVLAKILDALWAIYRDKQDRATVPYPINPPDSLSARRRERNGSEARVIAALQAVMAGHLSGIEGFIAMADAKQRASAAEVA